MPSAALSSLQSALKEVSDLRRADRSNVAATPSALRLARAVARAQVVLLSSHFERYFYAVNEEAIGFVNTTGVPAGQLPGPVRLLHSKQPIDDLAEVVWERRETKLGEFVASDAWLWGAGLPGALTHSRLLAWMKAPKPESLVRYYRYWGINDIFTAITRTQLTRNRLWLGIQELVDKRNNIAHGDILAQATQLISSGTWARCVRSASERIVASRECLAKCRRPLHRGDVLLPNSRLRASDDCSARPFTLRCC